MNHISLMFTRLLAATALKHRSGLATAELVSLRPAI